MRPAGNTVMVVLRYAARSFHLCCWNCGKWTQWTLCTLCMPCRLAFDSLPSAALCCLSRLRSSRMATFCMGYTDWTGTLMSTMSLENS